MWSSFFPIRSIPIHHTVCLLGINSVLFETGVIPYHNETAYALGTPHVIFFSRIPQSLPTSQRSQRIEMPIGNVFDL